MIADVWDFDGRTELGNGRRDYPGLIYGLSYWMFPCVKLRYCSASRMGFRMCAYFVCRGGGGTLVLGAVCSSSLGLLLLSLGRLV